LPLETKGRFQSDEEVRHAIAELFLEDHPAAVPTS
jgi:hypothetical protein